MARTGWRPLAAALAVCLCFGSIHAYGVLLAPIEEGFGISRTVASLGYAAALASLTVGVWLNGPLATRFSSPMRLAAAGIVAALGLVLPAASPSPAALLAGYGILFGAANGVAYALSLSAAAAAMPGRESFAMGLATAAYGLGAMLSAQIFDSALAVAPLSALFVAMAVASLAISGLGAVLIAQQEQSGRVVMKGRPSPHPRRIWLLWAAYLCGAFAGLMTIAHAPAIAAWRLGATADAGLASGLVTFGSITGGYLGGLLAERLPGRQGLVLPMLLQAAVLASLTVAAGAAGLFAALALAGLCYGVLIAVVPAAVLRAAGAARFAGDYGKVFSAWGVAGIAGPVTAGYIYDATNGYAAALAAASMLSCGAALLATGLREYRPPA